MIKIELFNTQKGKMRKDKRRNYAITSFRFRIFGKNTRTAFDLYEGSLRGYSNLNVKNC